MSTLTQGQTIGVLSDFGFRIRSTGELDQVVRVFQATWLHGTALEVDGVVGPLTSEALRVSEAQRRAGRGTISEHFSYREFACKCGGRYAECRRIVVERPLVIALERLRDAHYPGGLSIESGYRCAGHNEAVGGVPDSQHRFGGAADVAGRASSARVKSLGRFSGIGRKRSNGLVVHVDTRGQGGAPNTTNSSTGNPSEWIYAS